MSSDVTADENFESSSVPVLRLLFSVCDPLTFGEGVGHRRDHFHVAGNRGCSLWLEGTVGHRSFGQKERGGTLCVFFVLRS